MTLLFKNALVKLKSTKVLNSLLIGLITAVFSQSAFAEDEFVFNVPVSIERVDFSSATVTCTIYRSYSNPFSNNGPSMIRLAENSKSFSLRNPPNESVSRTVVVKVSTESPELARQYKCKVAITLMDGQVVSGDGNSEQFIQQFEDLSGDDLESARIEETGQI